MEGRTDLWRREKAQAMLARRTIDNEIPPLRKYLKPRMRVLDVGCGPGTITTDVAAAVSPGEAVGIDREESLIAEAREHARKSGAHNVNFRVEDANNLSFGEDSFDLAYSNAVLDWLPDPGRALKEQVRVTKRNGIVAANLGDGGSLVYYPRCPNVEKWLAALPHLADPHDPELHWYPFMGRGAHELFSASGLIDIAMDMSAHCVYAGTPAFDALGDMHASIFDYLRRHHKKLISMGVLEESTVRGMQDDLAAWHAHPHAFQAEWVVLATGRVP